MSLFSPAAKLIFISQVKKKPFQSTICVLLFHKIILNRQTLFFKLSIMLKYLLIRVHLAIVLVRLLLSSYGLSMQIIEYFRCVKLKLMKLKDDVFQLMTPTCCSNALLTSSFLLGHMTFCSPRDSVSGL